MYILTEWYPPILVLLTWSKFWQKILSKTQQKKQSMSVFVLNFVNFGDHEICRCLCLLKRAIPVLIFRSSCLEVLCEFMLWKFENLESISFKFLKNSFSKTYECGINFQWSCRLVTCTIFNSCLHAFNSYKNEIALLFWYFQGV